MTPSSNEEAGPYRKPVRRSRLIVEANMANRWEVEITDLDSACVTDGIELVNVYTLKLSASNAAEAKHTALGLWKSGYPIGSARYRREIEADLRAVVLG